MPLCGLNTSLLRAAAFCALRLNGGLVAVGARNRVGPHHLHARNRNDSRQHSLQEASTETVGVLCVGRTRLNSC